QDPRARGFARQSHGSLDTPVLSMVEGACEKTAPTRDERKSPTESKPIPFIPKFGPALRRWFARRVNPLLTTKEGARGRLHTRHSKTSPDPSLVRRGTLDERFIASSRLLLAALRRCSAQAYRGARLRLPGIAGARRLPRPRLALVAAATLCLAWMNPTRDRI